MTQIGKPGRRFRVRCSTDVVAAVTDEGRPDSLKSCCGLGVALHQRDGNIRRKAHGTLLFGHRLVAPSAAARLGPVLHHAPREGRSWKFPEWIGALSARSVHRRISQCVGWDSDDRHYYRLGARTKEYPLLHLAAPRSENARDDQDGKVVAFCGGGRGERRARWCDFVSAPVEVTVSSVKNKFFNRG